MSVLALESTSDEGSSCMELSPEEVAMVLSMREADGSTDEDHLKMMQLKGRKTRDPREEEISAMQDKEDLTCYFEKDLENPGSGLITQKYPKNGVSCTKYEYEGKTVHIGIGSADCQQMK